MGKDKALLPYKGSYLIQPAYSALKSVLGRVVISTHAQLAEKLQYEFPDATICIDDEADLGPLGGIKTVLSRFEETLLCLPCDAPLVSESLVSAMMERYIPPLSAVKDPQTERWEGLFSIWNKAVLPELVEYLHSGGRSVQGFLNQLSAQAIYWHRTRELKNINTPDDLNRLA
jgi:molybdopterin-guanine dinucleotide biosynthesis protein A